MRSNVIYTLAAMFAAFAQLAAVSAAFTMPASASADQPVSAMAAVSVAQERNLRAVDELIIEVRRPL